MATGTPRFSEGSSPSHHLGTLTLKDDACLAFRNQGHPGVSGQKLLMQFLWVTMNAGIWAWSLLVQGGVAEYWQWDDAQHWPEVRFMARAFYDAKSLSLSKERERRGSVCFEQLIVEVVLCWTEVQTWDVQNFLSWVLKTSLFRLWSFQSASPKTSAICIRVIPIWYK